jgi:predicted PurR-regulated permease PerM
MAFALHYIPFIGPLVATLFPTVFAVLQFGSWQMALTVFLGLNLIQFMSGSYIEPRIAGAALSVSPFLVLFAVFFWGFLWGIPGAFIGVPVAIALLTLCEHHPRGGGWRPCCPRATARRTDAAAGRRAQKEPIRLPSRMTPISARSGPTMPATTMSP